MQEKSIRRENQYNLHTHTWKSATGSKQLFPYLQLDTMNRKQTETEQKDDALQPSQGEGPSALRRQRQGERLPAWGWAGGDTPSPLGSTAHSPPLLCHGQGKIKMPESWKCCSGPINSKAQASKNSPLKKKKKKRKEFFPSEGSQRVSFLLVGFFSKTSPLCCTKGFATLYFFGGGVSV